MKVGQTFLSAVVRLICHPEECARETRSPRIRVGEGIRRTSSREDGRFFAALRMTRFTIAFVENCPSYVSPNCHPEEAVRPARESSAGRLTKDLLRHRLMPERLLSFVAD